MPASAERIAIVVLLILVALLPVAADVQRQPRSPASRARWCMAAIVERDQAYQPEALRRLQELIAVVPDHPALHVLAGNMQSFEGNEEQAQQHYSRAIELRRDYAGAHVNLGNLLFLNNEFQAAHDGVRESAEGRSETLAIAFYNHSVASGETYKFDQQAQMLEKRAQGRSARSSSASRAFRRRRRS